MDEHDLTQLSEGARCECGSRYDEQLGEQICPVCSVQQPMSFHDCPECVRAMAERTKYGAGHPSALTPEEVRGTAGFVLDYFAQMRAKERNEGYATAFTATCRAYPDLRDRYLGLA